MRKKSQYQVVTENLNFGQVHYFPRPSHGKLNTVLLFEEKRLLLSGAESGVACIYDWQEGSILYETQVGIGGLYSSLLFGRLAVLGGKKAVAFLDLVTGKVLDNGELKADCETVWVVEMGRGLFKAKQQMVEKPVLLFGGFESGSLSRVPLSRSFEKYSKTVLTKEGTREYLGEC